MIRSSSLDRRSRWLFAALVGLASGVLASGAPSCAESTSSGGIGGTGTSGTGYSGAGGDAGVIKPDGDMPPPRLTYAALCGEGVCVPGPKGDSTACEVTGSSTSATSSGTGAGAGGATSTSGTSSGASGSGGASNTTSSASGGTGGASSATSGTSSGTGVATSGTSGTGSPGLSCQIAPSASTPVSVCGPVGTGDVSAPCQSASDCGPGLGCSTDSLATAPGVALCRPYCCGSFEDCPTYTYCAKEAMAENPSQEIPVCMGITPCQLLTDGACPPDQTCSVVRADGTTSCIEKGSGQFCEACPCAPGFECSTSGVCQKLCHTNSQANGECGLGTCQGGSMNLPSGIGLCVGGAADCSHAK